MTKLTNCKICNKKLIGKQKMFCSNSCKCKSSNNKFQNYKAQQQRGFERKASLINKKGGCCEICGYNKNIAALCFHHIDPSNKSFGLDFRSISNRKLSVVKAEAEKCRLLCSNCHMELHHPDSNMS